MTQPNALLRLGIFYRGAVVRRLWWLGALILTMAAAVGRSLPSLAGAVCVVVLFGAGFILIGEDDRYDADGRLRAEEDCQDLLFLESLSLTEETVALRERLYSPRPTDIERIPMGVFLGAAMGEAALLVIGGLWANALTALMLVAGVGYVLWTYERRCPYPPKP